MKHTLEEVEMRNMAIELYQLIDTVSDFPCKYSSLYHLYLLLAQNPIIAKLLESYGAHEKEVGG